MEQVKVVCCRHPDEDRDLLSHFYTHLKLRRKPEVELWDVNNVPPGKNSSETIESRLNAAHIIIFLISAIFLASDEYHEWMKVALQRHDEADDMQGRDGVNEVHVIPVLLKSCDWEEEPFKKLQVLPRNKKPVATWDHLDTALSEVAKEISKVVRLFESKHKGLCYIQSARQYFSKKEYRRADDAYQKALDIFEDNIFIGNTYIKKTKIAILHEIGDLHYTCERPNLAIKAYDEAIELDPDNIELYRKKSEVFLGQGKFEDALEAANKACDLAPQDPDCWRDRGAIFYEWGKYKDAHQAYETALHCNPREPYYVHVANGEALYALKCFEKAREAYEAAVRAYARSGADEPDFLKGVSQKRDKAHRELFLQLMGEDNPGDC